jgi:anti-sigma factor RsiW
MAKKILKMLYRSFDDELDPDERKHLDQALKESEELQREKDRILAQRQALAESPEPSFESRFPERVMGRIETLRRGKNGFESFYDTLLLIFRRFAIVGAALLLLLLIYNLQTKDALSTDEIFYASDAAIEKMIDLPLF